jgi:hypothetical protein
MKKPYQYAAIALCLITNIAFAVDGNDWNAATSSSKHEEMQRILGNIKSKGCKVIHSPSYFVQQLDDFYLKSETRNTELPDAVGLIATGAGEHWDC